MMDPLTALGLVATIIGLVEFTAGFARMQGKRALFPLGYHVTGMPIVSNHFPLLAW